ncbi:MAG: heme anaerobic degradation radical SAM methyltransferase ChuW/HutW [Alphaproteobacteria bacterium]|nr:MAG: heme anaerobic degradation radical SAM methyltransferase ChuW/HutW [Alphaproteobacteria bacterium]
MGPPVMVKKDDRPNEFEMSTNVSLERFFAAKTPDPLGHAFARRLPMVHRGDARPVPPEKVQDVWRSLRSKQRSGKTVAYLHIPFCTSRCSFCGFYRNRSDAGTISAYVECLINELELDADSVAAQSGPIHAVFFGGGTPSLLSPEELFGLIAKVREILPLAPDCEITVEGRVRHFPREKAVACVEAGANRFSIGVQSFDTALRRKHGRPASRREVISHLQMLRDLDRAAIVCDLIYGFPNQSMNLWEDDVRTCIDLGIDGVDLYCLNLVPESPLDIAIQRNVSPPLPPMPDRAQKYARGAAVLADAGWRQLSNSHWAGTTRERNLYNLLVKQGAQCLAYGSCAGGYLAGHSYCIEPYLPRYMARTASGEKPIQSLSVLPDFGPAAKAIAGGLEVGHLDLRRIAANHGVDVETAAAPLLAQWRDAGLLEVENGRARLTLAGRFWASNLTTGLIATASMSNRKPTSL